MTNKPLTARLTVMIDLSNGHWIQLERFTFEDSSRASANFNYDDEIDGTLLEEALNKLQEAIL